MTPPRGNRQRRGGEVIKEAITEALARDVSDPRLGFVTITGVEPSPDFAVATVFVTAPNKAQREPSLRALESARGLLQRKVGQALQTRQTPHLEFVYDDTEDRARRIERLIDEIVPTDPIAPPDHTEPA